MRLCFNTTTATTCKMKLVTSSTHSHKVKLSVTINNCSCFSTVCFSSLVSTVSETYILENAASISGGSLSVPCVTENNVANSATTNVIFIIVLMLLFTLKLRNKK